MAKNICFVYDGGRWETGITRLERDKVYGWVDESVTDDHGAPCVLANMLDDGSTIILSGGTAMKTVSADTGREVERKSLKAVTEDGKEARLLPSVFDGGTVLEPANLSDLFNLEVASVYQLAFDNEEARKGLLELLAGDRIFRFAFNYRADYEANDAIMLSSQNEVFILTGSFIDFHWLENKLPEVAEEPDTEAGEDDFDFGML